MFNRFKGLLLDNTICQMYMYSFLRDCSYKAMFVKLFEQIGFRWLPITVIDIIVTVESHTLDIA